MTLALLKILCLALTKGSNQHTGLSDKKLISEKYEWIRISYFG
jgi:hypothetical protein